MLLGRKEVEPKNMAERSLSCLFGGGAKKGRGGPRWGIGIGRKRGKRGREVNILNKNFIKFSMRFL